MIIDDLRAAMIVAAKDKDLKRVQAVRFVVSTLDAEAKRKTDFTDEDAISVLRSEAKKRKEAIEAYQKAGKPENAEQEAFELLIIEEYLPTLVSEDEVREVATKVVSEMGKDNRGVIIGRVIGQIGKDKVDGAVVAKVVNELCS